MAESVEISIIAVDAASDIIGKIGDAFGPLGAAAAAGVGAAVGVVTDLVSAGSEAEDTMTRFNAIVDKSPMADYKQKMLDTADALSKVTTFENDNIVAAEGQLALYQNIGQNVFPQVTKTALDLATFMKTDATTGATTLGKALEDISGGSLSLIARTRLLTKEQKEAAQNLALYGQETVNWDKKKKDAYTASLTASQEAAQAQKAQSYVLDILNSKIGGLAETMGQTSGGQLTIFNNKLQEMKETLGQQIIPLLLPLLEKFSALADVVIPKVVEAFKVFLGIFTSDEFTPIEAFGELIKKIFGQDIAQYVDPVVTLLQNAINMIGNMFDSFNIGLEGGGGILMGLQQMFYSLDTISPVFDDIGDSMTFVQDALNFFGNWWTINGPEIIDIAQQVFGNIVNFIQVMYPRLKEFIDDALAKFAAWFLENGPLITKTLRVLADDFGRLLLAIEIAWDVISPILSGLIDIILQLGKIVMQMITGDWTGAWESAGKIVEIAWEAIKRSFLALASWVTYWFGTSWANVVQTWQNNWNQFVDIVAKIVIIIQNKAADFVNAGINLGKSFISGIVSSIMGGINSVVNSVSNIVGSILGTPAKAPKPASTKKGRASGGMVYEGEEYTVGEEGAESFIPATNGYISSSGGSRGGNFQFVYAPAISMGSEQEIMNWINKGIRQAQADGRLPASAR